MLSRQQISFIRSLHQKKYRQMYGKFLVEGDKLVRELLASRFKISTIFKIQSWKHGIPNLKNANKDYYEVIEVTEAELQKISTHENPNQVIAVAEIPNSKLKIQNSKLALGLYLACDNLSDPGNAGTIIRTAEWFGINAVFFSENSVDLYNPKVVNAAKGSLFRVPCFYINLASLFTANPQLPVYGTFMNGENIYRTKLEKDAVILIGNEANGISDELIPFIQHKITIPSFGHAESLNAGIAAGIVLAEFRKEM